MDFGEAPAAGIGARVRRKEDARHLAGQGQFVGDIRIAGMRDVAFLRSPVAHARIVARQQPACGKDSVIFLADLAGVKPMVTRAAIPGYKLSEWPAMADARVRFVGEIVARCVTGVPFENIRVSLGDTATTPFSTGAYASRGIVMAGGAVSRASEVVVARIKAIAAHLMQADADGVTFAGRRIHAGTASIGFADVGRARYIRPYQLPDGVDTAGLEATEGCKPGTDNGVFSFASHAAKVAVDAQTGLVEILDYCIAEDCGRMVNPMIVEGQTHGGAAHADPAADWIASMVAGTARFPGVVSPSRRRTAATSWRTKS
jgi:CO/xanthine dehydrogenase Mo-binding subunit